VKFVNGSFLSSFDGVFDANFGLQYTTSGTTWLLASGWTFTPSYAYNSSSAANVTYTFSGAALSVLGVRVVGQVHTSNSANNSWFDQATEVQAFSGGTTMAIIPSASGLTPQGPASSNPTAFAGLEKVPSVVPLASNPAGRSANGPLSTSIDPIATVTPASPPKAAWPEAKVHRFRSARGHVFAGPLRLTVFRRGHGAQSAADSLFRHARDRFRRP
jgi:hypothetical protein